MKRKDFIRNAAFLGAGLPLGAYVMGNDHLFTRRGAEKAKHVVFVLFAGGVRQQESVLQQYLSGSQKEQIEGNLMCNMLEGAMPDRKIVFGTTPSGEPEGSRPIPRILSTTLERQGTLFPEMRAVNAGHYGGLNSLITGTTAASQGLKVRPSAPTIFEYVRKHAGYKATDVWFIGNTIANSTPLLNCSAHPDYGLTYGANFFAPVITFGSPGEETLSNAKVYHPQEELEYMYQMKHFLDQTFNIQSGEVPGIRNTPEEKNNIKSFVKNVFDRKAANSISFPPVSSNGDALTMGYATEVLRWFKPKLLVANMSSVDSCHSNFTSYLQNLHRADHALGFLWNYIQTRIPEMAGNTILIAAPECGRNTNPNPIEDQNLWKAYDHSGGDPNAFRIWSMMAGPNVPANVKIGSPQNPVGKATDFTLTIADIFGIKDQVQQQGFIDPQARSLFDRM
jgi:hypothetical protein